jgi:hypothetical protein
MSGKILVDFDKTICPNGDDSNPPSKDCLDTLRGLQAKGNKIVIFSVRSNLEETRKVDGHNDMLDYLLKYKVPFDDVHRNKVHMDLIIDDRCACIPKDSKGNVDWEVLKRKLL